MESNPIVSVVFPIFNAQEFLADAIESVLNQTLTNFELIAVNDGSTDDSLTIIQEFAQGDSRVQIHQHEHNRGLIAALNTGCSMARGQYIAIMNSDDISLPRRFERQVALLTTSPEIGIVGSWIQYIDEQGTVLGDIHYPTLPLFMKWILPFYCPLAHPTVMMRRTVAAEVGFYREGQLVAEDYDLWTRISKVSLLTNVPEVLLRYRIWGNSWSARNQELQQHNTDRIAQGIISDLVGEVDEPTVRLLRRFASDQLPQSREDVQCLGNLIVAMYNEFSKRTQMSPPEKIAVAQDAANKLLILALQARKYSFREAIGLALTAIRISPPSRTQIKRGLRRLGAGNRGSYSRMLARNSSPNNPVNR